MLGGLALALMLLAPALPAASQPANTPPPATNTPPAATAPSDVPDVQMTVFAYRGRPEQVAVSYPNRKPSNDEIKADFAELAQGLGIAPPRVKINPPEGREGFVTAEAELTGLTNWSNGQINVDPVLRAFRDVKHLQIFLLFSEPIPLPPAGERLQPPLRIRTQPAGSGVVYDIWIDQSSGPPGGELTMQPASGNGMLWVAVGGTLLVLGLSGVLIWYVVVGQRRKPGNRAVSHASEGK